MKFFIKPFCRSKFGFLWVSIVGCTLFLCFVNFRKYFDAEWIPDTAEPDLSAGNIENVNILSNLKGQGNASFANLTDKKIGLSAALSNFTVEPLTIHCNQGRLGNQMCSLAVLQGVAALNHRDIRILPCNKKVLDQYFEVTIPEVNATTFSEHGYHKIGFYLTPEDEKVSNRTNIIKGYAHPCSFTFFNHIRQDIRKTFRFREKFRSNAEEILSKVRGNETNVTFVGVHVRRGDYVTRTKSSWLWAFDGREVDREYFEKATKYFRDKYPNVKFIVASEDLPWCRENLKDFDMYIPEKSLGPAYDMALLAQCNHTLMTYGTFGFWAGYFAGGDVVYFDKFLKPGTHFTNGEFRFEKMYLPEWIGIDTTKPGYWDTYVRPPLD